MSEHIHRDMKWSAEDRARHKALREKFQKERPTPAELLASGEYIGPLPHGVYLALRFAIHELKKAREAAGLSLADVAERSGIDKAALSRLENGVHDNPTVETLMRYAAAVGKKLTWKLEDLPAAPAV
jgi:DNA-binding XRE family transcriptional regulator